MDHNEAIQSKAAERYLLGELTAEEREQYEEHFFVCPVCAQEVTAGAVFMDNARDVLSSEKAPAAVPAREPRSEGLLALFLRPAFVAPAFAILLLLVAYQGAVVIPHLKSALGQATEPQLLPSLSLIAANSRGGVPSIFRVPANKPFSLYLDIPPGGDFPYYNCQLLSESGSPEFSVTVPSAEAKDSVQLLVPSSRLHSGRHTLIVRGSGSPEGASPAQSEVTRYSFTLEIGQ